MSRRRVLRILGIGIGFAVLLIGAALAFLKTPTAKRLAFEQVQKALQSNGVVLDGTGFDYSLLGFRLSLDRLSLRAASAPNLPSVFSADHLTAGINWFNLIRGRYWIEDVIVTNPNIQVVVESQSRNNIPKIPASTHSAGPSINWLILNMRTTGGSFTMDDRSRNLFVKFTDWEATLEGRPLTGSEEVQFTTKAAGSVRYSGNNLTVQTINARFDLNTRTFKLDVQGAQLASDFAEVSITGTVNHIDDPVMNLKVNSTIHLKPASKFLSAGRTMDGDLHADASINGRANQMKVAGHVNGDNLSAVTIDNIAVAANFAYDIKDNRVRLDSVRGRMPGVSLRGSGDLALAAHAGESRAAIQIEYADLERLSKLLKLPIPVASRATGSAQGRWPGLDFDRVEASGDFQMASPARVTNDRVPLDGALRVTARAGNILVSTKSIQSEAIQLSGHATLQSSSKLDGAIHVDISNVGKALIQIAGWSGTTVPSGLHLSGAAGADLELGGTLKQPRVQAALLARNLHLNELRNIDLNADAQYTPDRIDLRNVGLQWASESLTGSGAIGLLGASPSLDATFEISNASIHGILAALGDAEIPAHGMVNASGTVSGTIRAPSAVVRVSASSLEIYGQPFESLSATAHMDNQIVELDQLSLIKDQAGHLQATGAYDTTSGTYSVNVDGSNLYVSHLALSGNATASALLNIRAAGSGTVGNPGGTVHLSARELQVNNERLGAADLDATIADRQAKLTASSPAYGLTANASIATLQPYEMNFEIQANNTDVALFPVDLLKELSGHITATIDGSGNLREIQNAQAQAMIQNLNLMWRGHAISSGRSIALKYANRDLEIFEAAIRVDDSTATISGKVPFDPNAAGEVKLAGQTNLATLQGWIPSLAPVTMSGQLQFDARLRGNLKKVDPEIAVTIMGGSFATSALPAAVTGITLRATAKDGRLTLSQLQGEWAGAKIQMDGEAPLAWLPPLPIEIPRPPGASRLSVDVEKFKLSALVQAPQDTDGTVSLKIEAQADKPELDAVQAMMTLNELQLRTGPYVLAQSGTSVVELRNGIATVQRFELAGPETHLRLAGTADLRDTATVALKLEGTTELAVLALFTNAVRATGTATIDIAATGNARRPTLNGFVELQNGQALIKDPRITAENVQMRLDLTGSRIQVTHLEGLVNGGSIHGDGEFNLFGDQSGPSGLSVMGEGIYLEFPAGVRTVSNGRVNLTRDPQGLKLSGHVDIVEGTYTDPIRIDRGLLRYIESEQSTTTLSAKPNPLLRTRFDIGLKTLSPLVVDNNIAHGEINMEARLLGTAEQPGLTGRIDVEEGAELSLRERKYSVDRGVITFINDRSIEPVLDIEATTSASGYNITMQITGDATRKISTVLTSDPVLPEADIVSVLATGRTLEMAGGAGVAVAKEQVLSYIAGELGSSLTEGVGRALGLDQVRIEPSLIASEAEPTARLTIGKDITPKLDFVYSMNLRNSSDQIWIADYDLSRRFSIRGLRQSDNSYRIQFQNELLFGLNDDSQNKPKPIAQKKIGSIQFSGQTHLTEKQLANAAGLKTGKRYDFITLQNGRRRIDKVFAQEDRLEAQISVDRSFVNSLVDLTFRIKEGPRVEMVFDGWSVPADLRDRIRNVWSEGVIDAQRIADATELIEGELKRERFMGSIVNGVIESPDADTKRAVFTIQPGMRFDNVPVVFEGVHAIPEDELNKILKDSGFFDRDIEKRKQAVLTIERLYQDRGYIDAKVDPAVDELTGATGARTVIRVDEGPLYRFGRIAAIDSREFSPSEIRDQISIKAGEPYESSRVQKDLQTIEELYRKRGYDDVDVQYRQVKDLAKQTVAVNFEFQEGYQRILREVEVENNHNTSTGLIRSELKLEPGDIVSYEKLSEARVNLYSTGAYSFVEIVAEPSTDRTGIRPNQRPVRIHVRVREQEPWQVRYGGFYDTERGPGGIVDVSNHNMIGNARIIGVKIRYDSSLREARLYLTQPAIRRFPVKSLFSAFKNREELANTNTLTYRVGFSPTFEYRFQKSSVTTFGYRFEKVHSFATQADALTPLETRSRIGGLTSSITLDTRDDPIDATRGRFNSHSVEWSPAFLGSREQSIKYFGQYFAYFPLGKPSAVPWAGVSRNRVVAALAARLGMARGFGGQDVAQTERFFSGGGTTVRGFEQNTLGPRDSSGVPLGGDSVLVLNGELRFPLYKFVDGVTFADVGNVYSHLSDFNISSLRKSSGVGLRIRTPYVVIRLDYGRSLKPGPNDPRYKIFFSIGQAF